MVNNNIYIPWDGWTLVRTLGHGSFGTVYEIEKAGGHRVEKAAMKVISINADMLDDMYGSQYDEDTAKRLCEENLKNIRKEFDIMYELRGDPHIVRCDDMRSVGHRDGIGCDVYIMMELLTPLQKYMKSHSLSEEEILRLGQDICKALTVCEKHKIIHRDIKPQNILVSDSGTYKLGDFGTARPFEHTVSATMAGTETYMAPEVIRHEKYGRDVDTYSLGLVMYRMLNRGQLPFLPVDDIPTAEERAASLQRRLSGEKLPEPAEGTPALKAVVLKACSYDRKNRYRNASDMLEDLLTASEGTVPMFSAGPEETETVLDRTAVDNSFTEDRTDDSGGTVKLPPPEKKSSSKLIFIILALVIAGGLFYFISTAGGGGSDQGETETAEVTEEAEQEETSQESDSSASDTGDSYDDEELGWIEYEMWDHPDTGSGADNSDEYRTNFWTVYYDKSSREFKRVLETLWFDAEGYTEDDVNAYIDRLQYNNSDQEYSFIDVNNKGLATGDFGTQYVVEITYFNIDSAENRALADHIFMAVDWGTTIDDADRIIRGLNGVRYRASIDSEDEAIEWAEYFANITGMVPSGTNFGYMCTGVSTDSVGSTVYSIKGFEDFSDHIATYFNWEVDQYGKITDPLDGTEINPLKYTDN